MMDFLSLAMPHGKALLAGATHLAAAMPRGCDQPWHHLARRKLLRRRGSDTAGVEPMHLGQVAPDAIVLGQAPRASLQRQAEQLESLEEDPSGGIARRRVPQRRFCLRQQTRQ